MQRGSESSCRHQVPVAILELAAGLATAGALSATAAALLPLPHALPLAAVLVYVGMAMLVAWHWPSLRQSLGAANRVTVVRGALVSVVAATLLFPAVLRHDALSIAVLCAIALLLDGVDGWVARRTGNASAFGARFDMELDAFFILVLCVMVVMLDKAGPWVLAIGAMRYLFVLAMRFLPWLAASLPASFRRKLVCVVQVASLLLCLLPFVTPPLSASMLALALALLTLSFAQDVRWLFLHAAGQPARPPCTQGVRP